MVAVSSLAGLFVGSLFIHHLFTKSVEMERLTSENARLQQALVNADHAERLARAERRLDGPLLLLRNGEPANVVVRGKPYTMTEARDLGPGYAARKIKAPEGWELYYGDELVAYAEPNPDPLQKWAPR